MNVSNKAWGRRVGRRSFLRGAAGVSVALPFLESLPHRSAWAAGEEPAFALFMCASGGVVGESFFPPAHGPLTSEGVGTADKATSELARHADKLLFVSGVGFASSTLDPHQTGLCSALTGRRARMAIEGDLCQGCITAPSRSADWEICAQTQPDSEPLVLYWGSRGFTPEMLSYPRAGERAKAISNPYDLYQQLVGLAAPDGSTTPEGDRAARLLLQSRASVHDLVRDELQDLLRHPRLSSTDHQRLEHHFDSIRDVETGLGGMANEAVQHCGKQGLDVGRLESLKDLRYAETLTEEMVQLHLSLVALAFACNYRRVASLQWGDAYDGTIYDVPSNERGWTFSHISHRSQSAAVTDIDELAGKAHAEIDRVRMKTLARGLDHFQSRGLSDKCVVLWTNGIADGVSHSNKNIPHIISGSPRGYLKQAAYVDAGGVDNNRLLNTLISAAIIDTGRAVNNFGEGEPGQLPVLLA